MLTSILLVLALVLAVVIGPNVEQTIWGPALLALSAASVSALVSLWRNKATPSHLGLTLLGLVTSLWIAWRASVSPVAEWAQADVLLLASAVCSFICIKSIAGDALAEKILRHGIALLLLATVIVIGMQVADPSFRVLYGYSGKFTFTAGFYTHYNHCANFLIGASLLTLGSACFSADRRAIRIGMAIIGILGLVAIWFTQSRGGMLGAAVALSVLCIGILLLGYRNKAKWFPLAAIAFPIIGLAIAIGFLFIWQNAQETRVAMTGRTATISMLMDNENRLQLLGVAASCIGLHPLLGGGSHSFSWESLQTWNPSEMGFRETVPEYVHNEWLQAITDYGLIGGGLIAAIVFTIGIGACVRLIFDHKAKNHQSIDAWRLGGLAALAGVSTQACFSFVFHMLPDVILLGIFLAMASSHHQTLTGSSRRLQLGIMTLMLLTAILLFLPVGVKGSLVTFRTAIPVHGKQAKSLTSEQKIEAFDKGIAVWPMASLHQRRAFLHQQLATQSEGEIRIHHARLAAADYRAALRLNPKDGDSMINLANTLSDLQEMDEADRVYKQLVDFQGSMENIFRGRYHHAQHLYKAGIAEMVKGNQQAALENIKNATIAIDMASEQTTDYHFSGSGSSLQISCHEMLGVLFEAKGRNEEALASFERAAKMHGGSGRRIHFRSASLLANQANALWFKRQPEQALGLFLQARQCLAASGGQLPEGITEGQRDSFTQKLNNAIKILQDAKITPE